MTASALRKKFAFTDETIARIGAAVKEAETKTTGEIVVAVAPESDSYSFYELLFGLVVGAVCFFAMISFHAPIIAWLSSRFWDMPVWAYACFCGAVSYCVTAVVTLVSNWEPIDRRIIPHSVQVTAANRRAVRCFAESGVYKTKEQSGILIFVSYLERQVRIIADSGISAKIAQETWDDIAKTLANNIRTGKGARNGSLAGGAADALVRAVESCGALLAESFPPHEENPDEITECVLILESGT